MLARRLPLALAASITAACASGGSEPESKGEGRAQSIGAQYLAPSLFPGALVASADFDADSHADIALVDPLLSSAYILFNDGQGNFAARKPLALAIGKKPSDILAGDMNTDGLADLVISCEGSNNVYVFTNSPLAPSEFQTATYACPSPTSLAAGQLSRDPDPDIAAASKTNRSVTVLRNVGVSGFVAHPPIPDAAGPDGAIVAIDIGDLDNDKDIEEIITIAAIVGSVPAQGRATAIFLGPDPLPGQPLSIANTFHTLLPSGHTPVDGAVRDFDNDPLGLDDLVVITQGANTFLTYLNAGLDPVDSDWLGWDSSQPPIALPASPSSLAAGLLPPPDGYADVAVVLPSANRIVFLRNSVTGNPRFILEASIQAPPGAHLDLAHLNNDAKLDVVLPGGIILAN